MVADGRRSSARGGGSASSQQDAVFAQRRPEELRLADQRLDLRDAARAHAGAAIGERGRETALARVAERVAEVVGDLARRREAVVVVAEAHGIRTLEFDREIGDAAVVARREPVRLAERR